MTGKTQQPKEKSAKKALLPNLILILGLGLLLAGECYFGYRLHVFSEDQKQINEDYSTVNNITFGIFSIDLWKDKISSIVKQKIKAVKITDETKKEMREAVEKELHGMIDDVVNDITKPQKGLGNKLKKLAFKSFVDPKELHAQVPAFSKIIIDRATSKRATGKLKEIAENKFEDLAGQTFDSTQTAIVKVTHHMYQKYGVKDKLAFNKQIETRLENIRVVTYNYAYAMLAFPLVAVFIWLILRKKNYLHNSLFIGSLLIALVLLWTGTTVSIIEVDARIQSLELFMMGEKIAFNNQVLFFQSKSILSIAQALIEQSKPDAVTVGILIALFVILLPVLRIIARGAHMICRPIIAENKVTKYLAFEAGKWDMADVMVVGIGMTYIGLNGILKSQLTDLNMKDEFLTTTTVNYSSIQPGYIIFVGYVIFGIFITYMLKKITCARPMAEDADPA